MSVKFWIGSLGDCQKCIHASERTLRMSALIQGGFDVHMSVVRYDLRSSKWTPGAREKLVSDFILDRIVSLIDDTDVDSRDANICPLDVLVLYKMVSLTFRCASKDVFDFSMVRRGW